MDTIYAFANTPHYTQAADSNVIMTRSQGNNVLASFGIYFGVNSDEKVQFRFVKGKVTGGRDYSFTSQMVEQVTKAVTDEKRYHLVDKGFFNATDTLIVQMKVTDVGLILKNSTGFEHANAATLTIDYLGDR